MTQTSKMQIAQATIGTGAVGEAFLGGDLTDAGGGLANIVTVTNTSPDTGDTQVVLLWVPHDSSLTKLDLAGEANLNQDSAHVYTFRPTAGSYDGSWLIRMRETVAGVIQEEIRVFAVLSPKGIRTPALNEIADEDASLLFNGAVAIANSHANAGGDFAGWWTAYRKMLEEVEASGAGFEIDAAVQTTDGTTTTLATSTHATVGRGVMVTGVVQGFEPATNDHKVFSFTLRAHRTTGDALTADNLHIDNGPDETPGAVPWDFDVDVSGGDLRFRVTGEAAHTIDWSIKATARESAG